MKDLKSERDRSAAEYKHMDGSQRALRERHKRPDMQLYVPRALRRGENKTVTDVCAENVRQKECKKAEKSRGINVTDSTINVPSSSSESKLKKSYINMPLKPKSVVNESCDLNQSSTVETVTDCTTIQTDSNNIVKNETVAKSNGYPHMVTDDPQNLESSSISCEQTVLQCYSKGTENNSMAENTNPPISPIIKENIHKSINVKRMPSSTVDFKKEEMDSSTSSVPSNSHNSEINFTAVENISCSSLDIKSEVSSSDLYYTSDMDSLNICDKYDEGDVSLKISEPSNTLLKDKGDSWESMFNDDGECLDSDLVKELSSVTGKIQVRAAKNNYADYQPLSESVPQEYENIVELYGFPREFVTQDLISAFSAFQQSSLSIKWVDDCHALAIFTSTSLANQALQIKHPFLKVRPLSEGIKESKSKARWCAQHMEPQKPRPATSAVLARRLVSGALGLRVQATKEQRELERNILKEAKEKRRLKAKQKEAIWDGSVI